MAAGLGARVTILDVDLDRLRYLDDDHACERDHGWPVEPEARFAARAIAGGSVDRRRFDRRREGTGARAAFVPRRHEGRLRDRRCRRGPGRLCRDVQADDALRSDVCRGRRAALLRGEHARRGSAHVNVRTDQRHDAVRAEVWRTQGVERGSNPIAGFALGRERHRRTDYVRRRSHEAFGLDVGRAVRRTSSRRRNSCRNSRHLPATSITGQAAPCDSLRFGVPLVLGMFFHSLFNLVDLDHRRASLGTARSARGAINTAGDAQR